MPLAITRFEKQSVKCNDVVFTIDLINPLTTSFYIFQNNGQYEHKTVVYERRYEFDNIGEILFRKRHNKSVIMVFFVRKDIRVNRI